MSPFEANDAPKRKIQRLNAEKRAEIRKLFRSGFTLNDVHRKTGFCFGTLKTLRDSIYYESR